MKPSTTTGKELRLWRESRGWPRSWLADKLGVSASAMWKWEVEDTKVPLMVVLACVAIKAELPPVLLTTKG